MMDDEFEVGGMVLVQNESKTVQEISIRLAVTLCAAYEKHITSDGLALKVVEVARIFEDYLEEGYENQPEANVVSLKEV